MTQIEKDIFRLEHIRDCAEKIMKISKTLHNLNNFEIKWLEQDAMIRNFEIVGEASNHVSDETKNQYPDVDWHQMRGMRNFMTHEYFGIQLDTVWDAAINDIPKLKSQIEKIISDLENR
ncbi:MAG: DUF86 domain-containing protein [Flavobacteriaceae bacterium]|jgi:uncharacterized protein with HEPN domain|nr:DUF86 domain-containing protein [Flavobacteriaceae bacterium]